MPGTILRFCRSADWSAAQVRGEYRGDTLATEGFIHCSTADQVHLPANALVRGRTDIVLLEVDPARLACPVRWESGDPADPTSMRSPTSMDQFRSTPSSPSTTSDPDPTGPSRYRLTYGRRER